MEKPVKLLSFKQNMDTEYGALVALEENRDIPFAIRRVYYIYGVPTHTRRGFHAHRQLQQVLVCVSGSVKIEIKHPTGNEVFELCSPNQGLYIGPLVWREMYDFSNDAVLLVFADKYYEPDEYMRNYDEYCREVQQCLGTQEVFPAEEPK